jgi:hypothetical protein
MEIPMNNNSQAPEKTVAKIVERPELYGFSWGKGAIGKGTGAAYVELRSDAPHIHVTPESLKLFAAMWPNVLVKSVNGTSVKVSCDRVNRDTIDKDVTVSADTLKAKIVSNVLLGVITRTFGPPPKVFVGADGKEYPSLEAAKAAAAPSDNRTAQLEKAGAFLAMCAENGVDGETARNMAKMQFPLAYEPAPQELVEDNESA